MEETQINDATEPEKEGTHVLHAKYPRKSYSLALPSGTRTFRCC